MDILEALQEALEEATATAADYNIVESQVEGLQERLSNLDPRRHAGYMIGGLHRGVLDIAARHHLDCRQATCPTCDVVRSVLATVLASVRVMHADEKLEVEAGANPRRRRTRLLKRRTEQP